MVKLEVNVEKYLQEIFKERTELDMNNDLEVSHIKNPIEKKEHANKWLESRMNQLNRNEFYDEIELRKAFDSHLLEFGNYFDARRKLEDTYKKIKEQSIRIYNETMGEKVTST